MRWILLVVVAAVAALLVLYLCDCPTEPWSQVPGASSVPAYVISMPNARSRQAILKRLRPAVPNVQFFDGIDGSTQPRMGKLTPGETGCAMSHMKLWSDLSHTKVPFIVFEDDAQPVADFPARLEHVLKHLDDTIDVVFLGHCAEAAVKPVAPGLKQSVHPRCLHGYLVTPRGARKLARWASTTKPTAPIDEEVARLIFRGDMRSLSCDPPCVNTTGENSVIDSMGHRGGPR